MTEIVWTVLLLIIKVNTYTQVIRMQEVVWKVVEAVINTRIELVAQFHNELHRFCAGRGTGTTIMELKLA